MLNNVKKGAKVVRKSHNRDVIFVVDNIIKDKIAILTGITTRLKADSPVEDLEYVDRKEIIENNRNIDKKLSKIINMDEIKNNTKRSDKVIYLGKILHLDGDSCLDNKNSH